MVLESVEAAGVAKVGREESYMVSTTNCDSASAETDRLLSRPVLTHGVIAVPFVCCLIIVLQDEVVRGCLITLLRLLCSSE